MKKQDLYHQAKDVVAQLRGSTIYEHHEYIYLSGLVWLHEYHGVNFKLFDEWECSAEFWNWWKFQWNVRCYEVLLTLGFDLNTKPTDLNRLQRTAFNECFDAVHSRARTIYPSPVMQEKIRKENITLFRNQKQLVG